jgi:hypothetical protein
MTAHLGSWRETMAQANHLGHLKALLSSRVRCRCLRKAVGALHELARRRLAPARGECYSATCALARWRCAPRRSDSEIRAMQLCARVVSTGGLYSAIRIWHEHATHARVEAHLTSRYALLGGLRWWGWWTRVEMRSARLIEYAAQLCQRAGLRKAWRRWLSAASGLRCDRLWYFKPLAAAWRRWVACLVQRLRETRRDEAARRFLRTRRMERGCVQFARHCVHRSAHARLQELAARVLRRYVLMRWAETAQKYEPAEERRRAAVLRDVSHRFWRLRSLFHGFASLLNRLELAG